MNGKTLWAIIIIAIVAGLLTWWVKVEKTAPPSSAQHAVSAAAATSTASNLGTYAYECDEHVALMLTPSSDTGSIVVAPSTPGASYPPPVTLYKVPAPSGVRYEGSGIIMNAHGETVTLSEGDSAINCSPVPDPNNAPFNFGDERANSRRSR